MIWNNLGGDEYDQNIFKFKIVLKMKTTIKI